MNQKKYSIIYADPPWRYRLYSKAENGRTAESHYRTMKIGDICALPVADLSTKSCALFLWVTPPLWKEAVQVMDAWGFQYKTIAFVWVKLNKKSATPFWGMGKWTRANAEICVLATKGTPKRLSASVHQIVLEPREKHSKKPDVVRSRIVSLMGDIPRIELFARQKTAGWDVWGDEVESSIRFPMEQSGLLENQSDLLKAG